MEGYQGVKLVETATATVKMTGGTPFKAGSVGSSSSEEDGYSSDSAEKQTYARHSVHKNGSNALSSEQNPDNSSHSSRGSAKRVSNSCDELSKTTDSMAGKQNINLLGDNVQKDFANRVSGTPNKSLDQTDVVKTTTEKSSSLEQNKFVAEKGSSFSSLEDSTEKPQSQPIKVEESTLSQAQSSSNHQRSPNSSTGTPRVNPFNKDLMVDEEHFSDTTENYFAKHGRSIDSYSSSSLSQGFDWRHNPEESTVTFAELGLSEDHFSHPQGHFGLSGTEELELAVENCKDMIREAPPNSEKQKNLVLKLVQLRVKLHEIKEGPEPVPENVKVIMSHKMILRESRTSKYYCEKCNASIWGMLQVWYKCTECGYRCHERCLPQILRTCAKAKVLENPVLCMDICPADPSGLATQNYRCAECRTAISNKPGESEPRLCDYTGRYYCEFCHWNDTFKIPARILHNWDFTSHKVCRASKQFLRLMQRKAVIRIQDVNPMLFVYVDQLNEIKKLREEMMIMKKYILSCTSAMNAKLLLLLQSRQHFVENSDIYSLQDLLDTEELLLPELVKVHSSWAQHIKVDCELCQGRGFCCELCQDREVLFPFDNTAVVCATCSSVMHRHCFAKKGTCARCERKSRRKMNQS